MRAKTRLDRAVVVEAAAQLGDAQGGEVTLGQLAAHLGIKVPSLYNHVAGQEGLRRELALYGVNELAARLGRAAIGKAGDDAVRALAAAYRAFAKERPALYAMTLRAPAPDDVALIAASEEVLATIRAALGAFGLEDEAMIHAIRALRSILHGFVALEAAGGFGLPVTIDTSFDLMLDVFLDGLRRVGQEQDRF